MDVKAREHLASLINDITKTGEWTLDNEKLKEIKRICKKSEAFVEMSVELIFIQLGKKQAQIRYSALQLVEELFSRSHKFRQLIAEEFPQFLQLTIGIHQKSLPPPSNVASKLKEFAVALVKTWYEKYGESYRPLAIGYDYLISSGEANFEGSSLRDIRSRDTQRSQQDVRLKAINERRFQNIETQVADLKDDIQENLKNMESCFEILVPRFEAEQALDEERAAGETGKALSRGDAYKDNIMSHGLGSSRYTIEIDLSEGNVMEDVKESEDNEILFEKLRESYKIMTSKHLTKINEWLKNLVKIEYTDPAAKDDLLKAIISLKDEIRDATRKSALIGIDTQVENANKEANSDDEDDEDIDALFEEVEVPTLDEPSTSVASDKPSAVVKSKKLPPVQRVFPLAHEPHMAEDATYTSPLQAQIERTGRLRENSPSGNKGKQKADLQREELLKVAPVVEWGEDLYYWDKQDVQFNQSGLEYHHRFLGDGEGANKLSDETLQSLKMRAVYYNPQWPEKIKACRAPLRSGSLCPRRDLVTCPFHGPIIPRDEIGRPVDPKTKLPMVDLGEQETPEVEEDKDKSVFSSVKAAQPALWEQLENDVMRQQGLTPIESTKRGQKRKKEKAPSALIDVRKKAETRLTRLQRRLDDPRMKRIVEETLDHERSMKLRDKKANSWRGI
ncbi:hypothetical protein K450DRAFT_272843 [Umbelopsis ramanniana AG]|uniref:UV-stimulated scaffold protein A C-terminal domain-containing protein n=1 Tax=Umbelopsis ramanniana AG TaxID=1314678 RepID=A0AAD5E6L6_UMBRA|nr:uncharacterized protein K450DRAFT_272843 [Umbelopsis ramanniana AG]KAI8578428.1 hypothetical protein K450DRAFT_272843 [Umbelopsis ramanniana AG]